MPQLIARNREDYLQLASFVANKAASGHTLYKALRRSVRVESGRSHLFDMQRRAEGIERGVFVAWGLYRSNGRQWQANIVVA